MNRFFHTKSLFRLYRQCEATIFQIFQVFWAILKTFDELYPNTSQNIQLCFIYFFAFVDLCYAILINIFALGYHPASIEPFYPIFREILTNPYLKLWASPEKVFMLSYLVIEFMIVRPIFRFSKLIKYNVILIFSLLMIQSLVISYWDCLFNKHVTSDIDDWIFGGENLMNSDLDFAVFIYCMTFLLFVVIYAKFLIQGLNGKIATFHQIPGMTVVTDSAAFWIKLRTPTMKNRKKY